VTKYVPCGWRERVGFKGVPQRLKPLFGQLSTARVNSCPSRALFLASVCRFGKTGCPAFRGFRKVGVDAAGGVRALRGAEAPLFHGTAFVLLVLRKIRDQRQRRRTLRLGSGQAGVSDPHSQFRVPEDSHRFIFFDGQVTLLPVLGWGYWNRAGCGPFGGGGETKVPHFVRDDRNFVRNDRVRGR
jgi:hypothetical protein